MLDLDACWKCHTENQDWLLQVLGLKQVSKRQGPPRLAIACLMSIRLGAVRVLVDHKLGQAVLLEVTRVGEMVFIR